MDDKNDLMFSDDQEQILIRSVREGSKNAFQNIFERYYEPLLSFAYRYLKNNADAEGVVQDVFLWIWENRESWSVDCSLKSYLFKSVKNQCLDYIRHDKTKNKYIREYSLEYSEPEISFTDKDSRFDDENFEQIVKSTIEELPERAKLIYKMNRLEGLTYIEIAEVLEISPKTVESQISRALNILRIRLSKYMGVLLAVKKVVDVLI